MAAVLRHRGPDQYGLYRDRRVGLAHTRLSIVDLDGGAQPLTNEDGTVWISFNGEVFNHVELRAQLEASGHVFSTRTDTEAIVHAYEEWGEDAWRRLNGQFAFALWDRRRRRLHLVRDRLGILPLYYARVGDRVLFASEAKALFASGRIEPRLAPAAAATLLTLWSIPAPDSVFEGVQSVRPGCTLSFDDGLAARENSYWMPDLSTDPELERLDLDGAAERLDELLSRAVALRLRADVPVGSYLSGGIDSSVIADLVPRAGGGAFDTFSIGFSDPAFDERPAQREMVARLGTDHHEIVCSAGDVAAALPDVIWHAETPLTRTGPVPLFLLSGLVREHGRKVVLTGEGADELLAGYGIFKEHKIRRFWARQPESQARPALLSRLYPFVGRTAGPMWRAYFGRDLDRIDEPLASHQLRWGNSGWGTRFLSPEARGAWSLDSLNHNLDCALPHDWDRWRPLERAQALELTTFLSPYLLPYQGDRVAMAHGVEVRYPFLDPDVVDFCLALPSRLKLSGLHDKRPLRRLASRRLPRSVWNRPKHPYRAPTTPAFFGSERPDYVEELLSQRSLRDQQWIDERAAGRLVAKALKAGGRMAGEREEMALMGLLTLQLVSCIYERGLASRVTNAERALAAQPPAVDIDHTPDERIPERSAP